MNSQSSQLNNASTVSEDGNGKRNVPKKPIAAEIQTWLVSYIAELLEIESDEIDMTTPFDRYGLDSAAAVGMTGDLSEWLGLELDPTVAYDYPTIEALAGYLSEECRE